MTREEVIQGLQFTIEMFLFDPSTGETLTEPRNNLDKATIDACKGAIELLEQQPCEDCISREEAINELKLAYFNKDLQSAKDDPCIVDAMTDWAIRTIKNLPSVTPQPKRGKWIKKYVDDGLGELYPYWVCSECNREVGFNLANVKDVLSEYPYCHCGAKMVEPQESEE